MSKDFSKSCLQGLDARINGPFNDKSADEMVELLDAFMTDTGIEECYRIHFEKGMFLAQHPQSLDEEEKRLELEHAMRTPQNRENRERYLNLRLEEKRDTIRDLRSQERPARQKDFLELSDEEKSFVQRDKLQTTDDPHTRRMDLKKWYLPPSLRRLVTLCALGALVQGWDQSAINSAQLYYQDALGIWINPPKGFSHPQPWRVGLVNSAPYLCCVLSCWLTHPLNEKFGRRWTIFISCFFSAVFAFGQAFTQSWEWAFTWRLLLGLGIGPKSATIPIYAAEAAPQNVRGGLVMLWQVFTAFGIMLGYLSGVALQDVGAAGKDCQPIADSNKRLANSDKLLATPCSLKWRLMIGSPMIAPIILMLYIFTQPESSRWLIGKGHTKKLEKLPDMAKPYYRKAFEGLMKLRHTKLQAARDMFLIYHLLDKEQSMVREELNKGIRWYSLTAFQLVSIPRNRRAFIASLTCMFAQQFCGVNVIVYYSSEILRRAAGTGNTGILLYSAGFGIINFAFALPAFYLIDAFGRRSLLLVTFPLLGFAQLLTAGAFLGHQQRASTGSDAQVTSHWKLAIAGMYLFGIIYSPGEGPVPFVYAAESMPLYIRDIGMGCVTSINWLFNWLIAFTLPGFFVKFNAKSPETVLSSFERCVDELQLSVDKSSKSTSGLEDSPAAQAVLRWLRNRNELNDEWLVVVDNADDLTWGVNKIIPKGSRGSVIVTSQDHQSPRLFGRGCERLHVDTMERSEARALLLQHLGQDFNLASDNVQEVSDAIVDRLGYLALAIDLAGAYIHEDFSHDSSNQEAALKRYLANYGKHQDALLQSDYFKGLSPYDKTVWTVWDTTLETIERRHPEPRARLLLAFLAHFNREIIQDELFRLASLGFPAVAESLCHHDHDLPDWLKEFIKLGRQLG